MKNCPCRFSDSLGKTSKETIRKVGENPDTSVAGNRNPSPCEGDNKQNDSSCRGTRCRRDSVFQTYVVIVVCHVAAHAALGSPLTKEEDKNGSQEVDQDLEFLHSLLERSLESADVEDGGQISISRMPKWVNPCGVNIQMLDPSHHPNWDPSQIPPISDGDLLHNVLLAAKKALLHSKYFKDEYVKKTFLEDNWRSHHLTWKELRLEWLPTWQEIPKDLGQEPLPAQLDGLTFGGALKNFYHYLQRLAVGLEQIVADQHLYKGKFKEEFNEAEFRLRAVLCELQVAMMEKGISPHDDATRSIMNSEIRLIENETYRNLRDWYIYRDYMNGLEYVVHAFQHLGVEIGRDQSWRRRLERGQDSMP